MNYGEQTSNAIPALAHQVVVLPLGSLEQHGHHLPLLTDSLIGAEIARLAQVELGEAALFLPLLWVGASHHHRAFPGTVSAGNDAYTRLLLDVLDSLIASGFRRILLLNSHGGNRVPAENAIYQAQFQHRDQPGLWLVLASWFDLAAQQIAQIPSLQQKHVTHACELETSMLLHLRPDLVNMQAARGANIAGDSAFWSPDDSRPSRVSVARDFARLSQTGALGHPELATAEKGAALFTVVVREVVALINDLATWQEFEPG